MSKKKAEIKISAFFRAGERTNTHFIFYFKKSNKNYTLPFKIHLYNNLRQQNKIKTGKRQ